MGRRAAFLFLFLLIGTSALFAQTYPNVVKIGLFWQNSPQAVIVSPSEGSYEVLSDNKVIIELGEKDVIKVEAIAGGQLSVRTLSKEVGNYSNLFLRRKGWGNSFRVKATSPSLPDKIFFDNLEITNNGRLKLVNHVYIEHYIAGVVESESGSNRPLEYYKVQAIICRTYALANLRRHANEGFHLCDKVHCQVYHSKSRFNPDIVKGVNVTKGTVIVDADIQLITAAFSSNCGGHTANSEDVWTAPLPYLRSVEDTFCYKQEHAFWEKTIEKDKWLNYFATGYRYPIQDSLECQSLLQYCPDHREIHLGQHHPKPKLVDIRKDWGLSSSWFSIDEVEGKILLQGKGYGHAVGLCQEGAIRMATMGIPYNKILHHYYKDVHLINLSVIDFFRSD